MQDETNLILLHAGDLFNIFQDCHHPNIKSLFIIVQLSRNTATDSAMTTVWELGYFLKVSCETKSQSIVS